MTGRFALQALGLALLLGGGTAHAQEGAPCLNPRNQAELPQVLGPAFVRRSTYSFEAEAPGFGCSVRYAHPSGMWADVYIYRADLGVIEDQPRDPRLLAQFKESVQSIGEKWSQENGARVRDMQARYEARGLTGVEVMVASGYLDRDGQPPLRTHTQLWSGGGSIWKLRATFPASAQAASDPAVRALGDALVDISREARP